MQEKSRTVLFAILASLCLTAIKVIAGFITMSISLWASALDSFADCISMSINFAAVRTAEKPADQEHPFGHGKAEAIAALLQALFIAGSAAFLIFKSLHRMLDGYRLQDEFVGIVAIVVSLGVSIVLSTIMHRIAKRTESSALAAGALNYGADVWTNAVVLLALILERTAHVTNADPILSVLVSLYIVVSAFRIGRDAIAQLMDRALPQELIRIIDERIRTHAPLVLGYHRLRTRRVGPRKHIEFHLEIDRHTSFERAHLITEDIISEIEEAISGAEVTVHTDPSPATDKGRTR